MGMTAERKSGSPSCAPPRVIVADDSMEVRKRISAMLEDLGAVVVSEVADGLAAIEESRRLRPDLVVMDIRMPGVGGLEALPQIKALVPAPIVAIVTNHAHSAYSSRCAALGADYFLDKAAELMKLGEILDRIVEEGPADGR